MATIKSQKYKICGNQFENKQNPSCIFCIKEIRSLTGSGPKEAKDAYDGTAPLYFELIKDGSQKSIYAENYLINIQNYGGIVTLESTSGVKDTISAKAIEERYLVQAQNALKRYAKKLIDNGEIRISIMALNALEELSLTRIK